ncbi:MAG: 4Fe-4S dicluster domain-containing protein [Deltaproteobacteria bacterium]|nr:4Fe-4S dicluster domain-containing protein [Deltaproteobacteria bacterium]MBW2071258.1 4Fe-4S dicluster domain-containing protein [Deltaproteobacteria bacterium]
MTLFRVFFVDVLLQIRLLRQDFLRWFMHICIYGGFMLLLLMHALDKFITQPLFPGYFPTLNPFMFLRDLFGALVLLGIIIAVYRRYILKVPSLRSRGQDHYAILILTVIILSGVLLESSKITSYSRFKEMVSEYTVAADEEELRTLEAYWVKELGLVSPQLSGPFDAATLEMGKEAHEMNCAECHSRPQSAFLSYALSRAIKPIALTLDRVNILAIFWYIHFLACWLGLAYLPFSKMFHIFAGPLSLLANAVMEEGKSLPANVATREVMELDACTHCCSCSVSCSMSAAFASIGNVNILPSEKLAAVKAFITGNNMTEQQLRLLRQGLYLCTSCNRCTEACPVSIHLQDLWLHLRENLLQRGEPELLALTPFSYTRGLGRQELLAEDYLAPLTAAREAIIEKWGEVAGPDRVPGLKPLDQEFKSSLDLSTQASTFSACFNCQTCTTVCPVVASFEHPQEELGLLPHQIMHACALGQRDLALGSYMLWDCLSCYQCEEQCPQGVCLTEVFYELKSLAIKQFAEKISQKEGR